MSTALTSRLGGEMFSFSANTAPWFGLAICNNRYEFVMVLSRYVIGRNLNTPCTYTTEHINFCFLTKDLLYVNCLMPGSNMLDWYREELPLTTIYRNRLQNLDLCLLRPLLGIYTVWAGRDLYRAYLNM